MGVIMSLPTHLKILLLAFSAVFLGSCSSRAIHEAEAVVAQADSLWQAGLMYGIDAGDSLTLAQAYKTLKEHSAFSRQLSEVFPFVQRTSFLRTYAHACYHYGKLLRAKDHPAEAMQAFINATHSRTRDYHILGRVYNNIGDMCHLAGEYRLSYEMFEKSADMYLQNGDTLLHYYSLNDMAFELVAQKDTSYICVLLDSIQTYNHSDVILKSQETKALMYLQSQHYQAAISLIDSMQVEGYYDLMGYLLKAQAYEHINQFDSAVSNASFILSHTTDSRYLISACYILSHVDKGISSDSILELTSIRADAQKDWGIRNGQYANAVQLLEKDLERKPDWQWLYAVIATVLIIGAAIVVYVYRKHKKHDLLAQKISDLTLKSNAVQANHEKLVNRYESQHQRREEETLHRCALLRECPQIAVELKWSDFDAACSIIDSHFYLLASKLRQKAVLNETEIRLCILVLIGLNRIQIANTMPYALNSIGKLKDQTAKKLGTSGKNLRDFLIKMVVDE